MIPAEALCPTVGANCRGVEHGRAIGDGKEGTHGCIRWLTQRVGHGALQTQGRTQVRGPLGEVTPLLLQDELCMGADTQYRCSLSCFLSNYRWLEEDGNLMLTLLSFYCCLPRTLALPSLIYWSGGQITDRVLGFTVWIWVYRAGPAAGPSQWSRTQSALLL